MVKRGKAILILSICILIVLNSVLAVVYLIPLSTLKVWINNNSNRVSIDNGMIKIEIDPAGKATLMEYNKRDLIGERGNFYMSYAVDEGETKFYNLNNPIMEVIRQTPELVEVMYRDTTGPIIIELHYVVLKGSSGCYAFVVAEGKTDPAIMMELRVVYRANPDIFNYAYTSDDVQGFMPTPAELEDAEAVQDATYLLDDASIYTKYDWANYIDEDLVHGLMGNANGMWLMQSSKEYVNGGPDRQELMVHQTDTTPLVLSMLQGEHFGALAQVFGEGDEKLYGPFFLYVNSGENHQEMIDDAKEKAIAEQAAWPYDWMQHPLFELQRSTVIGNISTGAGGPLENAMIVLAKDPVNVYDQGKDYIFWTKANNDKTFSIPNVIPGNYTLFVYGANRTDDLMVENVTVTNQSITDIGQINWTVNSSLQLLWQLGDADRRSLGFRYCDYPRQYGLWELVPSNLTFNINMSIESTDWYYAQTKIGSWKIEFNNSINYTGGETAMLTIGIAGVARYPDLDVYLNSTSLSSFSFGNEGSIYRSAINSGRYRVKTVSFPASNLSVGINAIDLRLIDVSEKGGIMYDVIKLEVF
ncbi:MAG: polysaccharide lyase family protein [Candidatus Hodarchaeota archaeon]